MEQVAVTFAQARRRVSSACRPSSLRCEFEGGELSPAAAGKCDDPALVSGDVEMLYILTFYLPRFLEQSSERN